MKIYYGIPKSSIDVTEICLAKMTNNNIVTIPAGDANRASYFTDPLYGILKKIYITHDDDGTMTEYDDHTIIQINLSNNTIHTTTTNHTPPTSTVLNDIDTKIRTLHSRLQIRHGNFQEELPEQKMAVRYLTGNEKVLEIGGNIGRNTLIIASILGGNNHQFVSLECDSNIATQLTENRDLNHFQFHIENSALSARKLIQKGWDTMPSDVLLPGYSWVNTITMTELKQKYSIAFDTLVLDCEGAFYYILMDTPEILENINLIIMENDYHDITHKTYVDNVLTANHFHRDYVECGGWGPCYSNFFEVWKKPHI